MTDACTLPPQVPALKLRIEGPPGDPIERGTGPGRPGSMRNGKTSLPSDV
jgi:hypothetical protein